MKATNKLGKAPQSMLDALARRIADGACTPGSALGSERDLARMFNVSRTTVARAVGHLLEAGLAEQTPEQGLVLTRRAFAELGKAPAERPEILFIRISDNYLNNEIYQGMVQAPGAGDFDICMVDATGERNDYSDILNHLSDHVHAVVLFPLELPQVRKAVKAAHRRGVVIIQIDRVYADVKTPGIVADDIAAGALATRHLLEAHGGRPVYFLGYHDAPSSAANRFSGWRQAMLGAGYIDCRHYLIPGYPAGTAEWWAGDHYKPELREFLAAHRNEPVSVFAVNDGIALGVYQCCADLGLRIGRDVFISGCGNENYCAGLTPPLTSVHSPYYQMGREAVNILHPRATHKRTSSWCSLLPVELMVRASSAGEADNDISRVV